MIRMPAHVTESMKRLADNGFAVYAVGGCVRDALMGRDPTDWDLATNARLPHLEDLFPEAKVISEKYSVIRRDFPIDMEPEADRLCPGKEASHLDIATFRTEGTYTDSRRPDWVRFVKTVEEDLKRRDFTINAIAYGYAGELVDPLGGMADLQAKTIRCIGEPQVRFNENPIRMLRAARMAAEYGFSPDAKTFEAMAKMGKLLAKAGPDRIRTDFLRLIGAPDAARGLDLVLRANLLEAVCGITPELVSEEARCKLNGFVKHLESLSAEPRQEDPDGAREEVERRLAMFYRCFGPELANEAMLNLHFDKKTRKRLEYKLAEEIC